MSKNTVINRMVNDAALVMEMKMDELKIVAEIFKEKGDVERVEKLEKTIERTAAAIEVMRENAGCWA